LNEIQSANSQTLIKSEVLNSSSNSTLDTNYGLFSDFQNTVHTLKYKQADLSNSTKMAYGYSVDKDGYMGSDFNKAVGLPEDFKIHKSTLDEIERYNTDLNAHTANYLGVSSYYSNIDMADTIRQYYSKFNQIINHSFGNSNKTSFSVEDLNSLPKGYSIHNTDFKFMFQNLDSQTITNYYNTQEQYDEMEQLGTIAHINVGLQPLNFTPQSMQTQNLDENSAKYTFNPDMSVYPQNEDGSYTKEDLFMSFLKSSGGAEVLAGGNTTLNPLVKAHIEAMTKESFDGSLASLDDIMTGKVDFASLLKGYAQDGWLDAGIYAMEKGVAWQNASIGYGGAWFDNQFNQAKANGWKASNESINSFADSIADRLNNLIGQTRV
ncbi:TPA: hypothetical protein R1X03_001528, partial [Campylobacter jejuni]|nr:hypothetical protein [Campylobacter jejuni]HEC1480016.1 hypothetical protein [Campylobacter jejuni]HEC1483271.1 hypothetical protein [Campylobacter jejuni]HEC1484772.1 hypothetical protein [Campylobacter jejuni]